MPQQHGQQTIRCCSSAMACMCGCTLLRPSRRQTDKTTCACVCLVADVWWCMSCAYVGRHVCGSCACHVLVNTVLGCAADAGASVGQPCLVCRSLSLPACMSSSSLTNCTPADLSIGRTIAFSMLLADQMHTGLLTFTV